MSRKRSHKELVNRFIELYKEMYQICQEGGFGDPFSYARSREIYMAGILNHQVAETYSGADGYDENGQYEYKSTINKKINGTYNGISVQPTLEEQIKYIKNDKIGKYGKHYYARFDGAEIAELYVLDAKNVLDVLLPRIEKEWVKKSSKNCKAKDPRIGVTIKQNEIYKYGKKVI